MFYVATPRALRQLLRLQQTLLFQFFRAIDRFTGVDLQIVYCFAEPDSVARFLCLLDVLENQPVGRESWLTCQLSSFRGATISRSHLHKKPSGVRILQGSPRTSPLEIRVP